MIGSNANIYALKQSKVFFLSIFPSTYRKKIILPESCCAISGKHRNIQKSGFKYMTQKSPLIVNNLRLYVNMITESLGYAHCHSFKKGCQIRF
jgi:hypothetical protein